MHLIKPRVVTNINCFQKRPNFFIRAQQSVSYNLIYVIYVSTMITSVHVDVQSEVVFGLQVLIILFHFTRKKSPYRIIMYLHGGSTVTAGLDRSVT